MKDRFWYKPIAIAITAKKPQSSGLDGQMRAKFAYRLATIYLNNHNHDLNPVMRIRIDRMRIRIHKI